MTRINLVPPVELMDQHLFAEFREIKMVPKSLGRSLSARGASGVLRMVPREYTLGTGHVSFFYDKGAYLRQRFLELRAELTKRGIQFNVESQLDPDNLFTLLGEIFNQTYVPTESALKLVRQRIAEKIAMKPNWYRYTY
jgi:deoxyribonuclease (pyrimidine dimer)